LPGPRRGLSPDAPRTMTRPIASDALVATIRPPARLKLKRTDSRRSWAHINSQDRCRDLRGAKETRQPPGTGTIRKSLSLERSSSGSTDLNSSGAGSSRSSRRRVVGGTGGGAGSSALGNRDLTAARSGSPCGITAPHAVHVLPPWFTPSHTGQRQTLMAEVGRCVSAGAFRRGGPGGATRWLEAVASRSASPCHEGRLPEEVCPRPPMATSGP
jgi:hypothetical protein